MSRRGLLTGPSARADAVALEPLLAAQQLALACLEQVAVSRATAGLGAGARRLLAQLAAADRAHVAATRTAIRRRGGRPAPAPSDDAAIDAELARHLVPGRPARLRGVRDGLLLLVDVERVAVGAAYVAVDAISAGPLAATVAAMMASDAQHEALLAELLHPGDIAGAIPFGVVEGTG